MKPRENGLPGKTKKSLSVSELIQDWLLKLAVHFKVSLEEEQISIFVHALRNNTPYQIEQAFERCLNECEFMPRLAQIHQRMPEQRYATENPGRFVVHDPPILDVIRKIVYELHPDYDSITDPRRIKELFAEANRERYKRMGVEVRR